MRSTGIHVCAYAEMCKGCLSLDSARVQRVGMSETIHGSFRYRSYSIIVRFMDPPFCMSPPLCHPWSLTMYWTASLCSYMTTRHISVCIAMICYYMCSETCLAAYGLSIHVLTGGRFHRGMWWAFPAGALPCDGSTSCGTVRTCRMELHPATPQGVLTRVLSRSSKAGLFNARYGVMGWGPVQWSRIRVGCGIQG
jgi:hypothetical protein